jgi:transcriptional regulator with XRE-family HTH domain
MAAEHSSAGLGAKLRAARERRGLSLEQIATTTKISLPVLRGLELDDISRLPGGIFSRAFVRAYATAVGLDPDEAIQEFIAQSPQDAAASRYAPGSLEDHQAVDSERRVAIGVVRLATISVLVAALLLYFGATGLRTPSAQPGAAPERAAGGTERMVATAARSDASAERAAELMPSIGERAPAAALTVVIAAHGPCWVSAIAGGTPVLRREMRAGERHTLEIADELVLTLGDPAAVVLSFNGAVARPLGRAGRAVTIRLNRSNFTEYLSAS